MFLFLIYLLGSTADQYFSPALTSMSKSMNLSPSVAGVTLLAFGNGAPDVFSSILAAKKLKVSLTVGALFGGAIFVSTTVLGRVTTEAGACRMDVNKTLRDMAVLAVTAGLIMIYGFIGEITLFQACLFPTIYIFYVFSVFYMEKAEKKLMDNYFEMPTLESNFVNWSDVIEDYVDSTLKKREVQPAIRYSDLEWSLIKHRFFSEIS